MNEIAAAWRTQKDLVFGSQPQEAESILWSWLGSLIGGRMNFEFFLNAVSNGRGAGDDSGGVLLPANIVADSYEGGNTAKEFCVQVHLAEYGDGPDRTARMTVPRFLFCSSVATVMHATHINQDLDPYAAIERMRAACSPEAQFALVRDLDRQAVGLELEHWQRQAELPETILG